MKRYVYLLDLKPDEHLKEQYLSHHQKVWSCIPKRLKEIGIVSNQIYRCGNRLVNLIETVDEFNPAEDLAAYANDPECREWDLLMRTFQQKVPGAAEDEWWALCEKIYDYHQN